jgi:hypothetical protein
MARVRRQILAGLLFGALCGVASAYAVNDYTQPGRVQKHSTYDAGGAEFYEIRFTDGSALTISVDGRTKVAKALHQYDGKRITFSLTPEPERLTR